MDTEMMILWVDLTLAVLALLILVTLSIVFAKDKDKLDKKLINLEDGLTACRFLIRAANWTHITIIDIDRRNDALTNTSDTEDRSGVPSSADADGTTDVPTVVIAQVPKTNVKGEEDGDTPGVIRTQTGVNVCSGNGETQC